MSLAALLCFAAGNASAQIPAGIDCWETEPDTKAGIPDLPPGFFGPGSDPFPATSIDVEGVPLTAPELANCGGCPPAPGVEVVWVDMHGDPVEPDSVHRVTQIPPGEVDTCVARLGDAEFLGGVGVPDPIPVEIIELSLKSVEPIVVEFNGGTTSTLWNVFVTESGIQATGQLTLTPATLIPAPAGPLVLDGLPLEFDMLFEELGGPGLTGLGGLSLNFQGTNGNFQQNPIVPAMSPVGVVALVVALGIGSAWLLRRRYRNA